MKWFRRSDTGEKVPAELEPYYENKGGWRLWVRRIVTVLFLLLLLFLLAWGARSVYQRATSDNQAQNNTNQLQEQKRDQNKDDRNTDQEKDKGTVARNNQEDSDRNAGNQQAQGGQAPITSGQASETNRSGQPNVPAAGDSSGNKAETAAPLPDTGPEEVIPSVIAAIILGSIFHRLILSRLPLRRVNS